jgi:Ca-activated chloride channel family protein
LKLALKRREKTFSGRNYDALSNYRSQPNFTLKITLYLAAAALVVFAAARPQGLERPEEVEASSIDICFAVDVSESMKALDLGRDNRLDITKAVVSHLIDSLKTDRVALVAFAGDASCLCPLTLDHASAKSLLMQADFDLIDRGGTRLDLAIKTAAERFNKDDEAARVIVVFTDGEDHDGKPAEAAREAYKNGIVIHCVGIGSGSGVKIPVSNDIWGAPVYKKYKGRDVVTKLNERVLTDVASAAGGGYFHVSDQKSLTDMVAGLKNIKKRALRVSSLSVREELFGYFAFLAFILLAADSLLPSRSLKKSINAALLAFFSAAAAFSLACPASAETAPPPVKSDYDSLSPKISEYSRRGAGFYGQNNFSGAEFEFQNAKILKPSDIASNYNIGCARYKNRDYKGALESFAAAAKADKESARFEPYYNMGNAHFKLSDYKGAIDSYEKALKIKPGDPDAAHNLELARKKLEEEMKKDQSGENKKDGDKSGDKNEKGGDKSGKDSQDGQKQDGSDRKNGENQSGDDKKQDQGKQGGEQQQKDGENDGAKDEKSPGASEKEGDRKKDGAGGEEAVKDLADKQNIEKYRNIQVDPNRLKMFLKDLENDETRVQYLYQRNKKRMNARDRDETDIFNLPPEEIHERMLRQMLPEGDPRREKAKERKPAGDKKDW